MTTSGLLRWLLAALAAGPLVAAQAPDQEAALLHAIRIGKTDSGVTVRIELTHPREPERHVLVDPYRVYFDLPAVRLQTDVPREFTLGHELITGVRIGQFSSEPMVARVVLDLTREQVVRVDREAGGKVILFILGTGAEPPGAAAPPEPKADIIAAQWLRQNQDEAIYAVRLSQLTSHSSFFLTEPDRIVIDIESARLKSLPVPPGTRNGIVGSVRAQQLAPDVVRWVFELKSPAGFVVLRRIDPARLEVRIVRGKTKGRVVVVDPGHGGKDPGAIGYDGKLHEADVVLDVGKRVATLLRERDIRPVLTREDDSALGLYDRPEFANQMKADLFVSLHANAMPLSRRGEISGTELYYHHEASKLFATIMLREVCRQTGLPDRGIRQRRFVVVRETLMPSVLVEFGYMDNQHDGRLLATPDFRQRCALGVTNGVVRFLERMPPPEPSDQEAPVAPERLGPSLPPRGQPEAAEGTDAQPPGRSS